MRVTGKTSCSPAVALVPESVKTFIPQKLIRSVLEERGQVVLDELRWIVLQHEADDRGRQLDVIERGPMQSFARTVREHMPNVACMDVALGAGSRCPVALLAATAVYRLRHRTQLDAFLSGPSPTIAWEYVTNLPVEEFEETPRYVRGPERYVVPQFHLYLVDLYAQYERDPAAERVNRQFVARVRIPPAHKVTW